METPSAPQCLDIIQIVDMEHGKVIPSQLSIDITPPRKISCYVIVNGIIYILLICAITFIIYEHHKIIGIYLSKIRKIKL